MADISKITIESGTYNIKDAFLRNKIDYVTPEEFGAVGDGENDDTASIQNAINYCITNKVGLLFHNKTYLITDTLTITGDSFNLYCDGELLIDDNITLLDVTGDNHKIYINKMTSSSRNGIGLYSHGRLAYCNIEINNINDFDIGISLDTSSNSTGGILYNYFKSSIIIANKCINLNGNTRYVNQNYFYMGGLMGITGIYSEEITETNGEYNGNCFYNCGFENLTTAIDINNMTNSVFENFRLYESVTGTYFIKLNNSIKNLFKSNITSAILQNTKISDNTTSRQNANIFDCFITLYGSVTSQYARKCLSYNGLFEVIENATLPVRYSFGNATINTSNLGSLTIYNEFSCYNSESDVIINLDSRYTENNNYSNDLVLFISYIAGNHNVQVFDSNNNKVFDLDNFRSQVTSGKTALFKFTLYNGTLYPYLIYKTT